MTDRQTKESVDKNFTVMFILREINSHRFFRWKSHTTPHVCLLVCRSVCWSVGHNFLKGREVSCFYHVRLLVCRSVGLLVCLWQFRSSCFVLNLKRSRLGLLFVYKHPTSPLVSIYLSVNLSIYLSINLSICQSIYVDMAHVNRNITVSKEIEKIRNICTVRDMA